MPDMMTPPPDALISPSGPIWLNEDGIIITITTATYQTLEDAKVNMEYSKKMTAGTPRPMLVDMSKVRSINKEAREEYVKKIDEPFITAVALLTNSNISRMVGNFFIGLNNMQIPAKLFTDPEKARVWLLQYIVK
mgnify:CR=1 FL=1